MKRMVQRGGGGYCSLDAVVGSVVGRSKWHVSSPTFLAIQEHGVGDKVRAGLSEAWATVAPLHCRPPLPSAEPCKLQPQGIIS